MHVVIATYTYIQPVRSYSIPNTYMYVRIHQGIRIRIRMCFVDCEVHCYFPQALIIDKATPIGIPVSGPVQTEKDMRAGGRISPLCHYNLHTYNLHK